MWLIAYGIPGDYVDEYRFQSTDPCVGSPRLSSGYFNVCIGLGIISKGMAQVVL
jgi:hypothetical protein